jgi:hypothetical protein
MSSSGVVQGQRPSSRDDVGEGRDQPGQQHAGAILLEQVAQRAGPNAFHVQQIAGDVDHQRHAKARRDPDGDIMLVVQIHPSYGPASPSADPSGNRWPDFNTCSRDPRLRVYRYVIVMMNV